MRKIAALLLCLVLSAAAGPAAAEGSDRTYVTEKGTLIIGVTEFAPMDYRDEDGEWIGFDADMARAFAAYLGVEAEFREIEWPDRFRELDEKNIDCLWNAMTLSVEAQAGMSCSRPYMYNAQMIILPADKASAYAGVEDMASLTFAVKAGTVSETIVTKMGYRVKTLPGAEETLAAVQTGEADAAVIDYLVSAALVGKGKTFDDLVSFLPLNEEKYAVGFRKGSDLVGAANLFLASSMKDGTMEEIAHIYNVFGTLFRE